jgi:hypothetical protein
MRSFKTVVFAGGLDEAREQFAGAYDILKRAYATLSVFEALETVARVIWIFTLHTASLRSCSH